MNINLIHSNSDYLFKILSYINSSRLQEKLMPIRITFFVISLLFLFFIVILLLKTSYLRLRYFSTFEKIDKFLDMRRYNLKANRARWNSIVDKVNSGNDLGVRLGIIEADKILKKVLPRKFILDGKDFEDQLKNLTQDKIPNIEEVRRAHEVAQKLITSSKFKITREEAKKLLAIFKNTFQYLELI